MAQVSAHLEEEISILQTERSRVIEKRPECFQLSSKARRRLQKFKTKQRSLSENGQTLFPGVQRVTDIFTKEPVRPKDAATYKCRERKSDKCLTPVAPIVSHEVVEEQRVPITFFQATLKEYHKQLRTDSESS